MICLRLAKFFQPFKIRLLRIFCTWLPLRPSEDTPVEYPGREPGVQFGSVMPNPDKPEQKRSHAKPQRRKENLQSMGNPKKAIKNNW